MNSACTTPSNDAISAEAAHASVISELAGKAGALTAALGRLVELEGRRPAKSTEAPQRARKAKLAAGGQ